jgi:anti-sigma regulatory factor (Ser/Thr protein kinase)/GNAT superfamily N-acetyltransferase
MLLADHCKFNFLLNLRLSEFLREQGFEETILVCAKISEIAQEHSTTGANVSERCMMRSIKSSVFEITLAVPAIAEFASVVGAVVDDVTDRIGLDDGKRARVRRAVARAFTLLVAEAMAESQDPVRLHFSETADALRISIRERGLPIDDRRAARDPRWHDILEYADRTAWHWHGTAGTELQLTFLHEAVTTESAFAPASAQIVQAAPEQTYTVRRFLPEDARGVVRCFYANYGYGYDVPAVYEPRRLAELNRLERYISFVAIDNAREIVGHYALDRQPGACIAEGCGAVVDPHHRGRHLLERLRSAAEQHAKELGLVAYFTEPVTDHAITQNESEKSGARLTAISLGFSPPTMLAKHMDLTGTNQRQSLTLYVKALSAPEPRIIYPPAKHREILQEIYSQLHIPVDIRQGSAASGEGSLHVDVLKSSQNATMTFERVGAQTVEVARQALADLLSLGSLGVIYAMLPLADPGTPALADVLESEGFFFSGLAPWMLNGGDALRLQRLLRRIDTAALTIASDFGRRLLTYIDASAQSVA